MRLATADLESIATYSQKQHVDVRGRKEEGETLEAAEYRMRYDALHLTEDGHIYIPAMSLKLSMSEAARYLSIQKKGTATWTKHFANGVQVVENIVLPVKKEDVSFIRLEVPSDGKTGGGKRVPRYFSQIKKWRAKVPYMVLDEEIPEEIFQRVLVASGTFIGIGVFRPSRNGFQGMFKVHSVKWSEM